MKVKVNRRLSAGYYHINFEVSDFTSDEIQKMGSFGVPQINIQIGGGPNSGRTALKVALNQISGKLGAGFSTEAEAKKYEDDVFKQIRSAVQRLRESEDKFSSSEEVAL
jgi:hypothetical protein